jgi:hypothetical protein
LKTLASAQYNVLKNEEKRRVIFCSPFGTGKTILLKAKAKELLARKERVVFIIFGDKDSSRESLLTITYRSEFENISNASIEFLKGPGNLIYFISTVLVVNSLKVKCSCTIKICNAS